MNSVFYQVPSVQEPPHRGCRRWWWWRWRRHGRCGRGDERRRRRRRTRRQRHLRLEPEKVLGRRPRRPGLGVPQRTPASTSTYPQRDAISPGIQHREQLPLLTRSLITVLFVCTVVRSIVVSTLVYYFSFLV